MKHLNDTARQIERAKYERIYKLPDYKMGAARLLDAQDDVRGLPFRTSYLDVGCGRGEMLDFAEAEGFVRVQGVEAVPYLCDGGRVIQADAWDLPFKDREFSAVSMFDVIEHLLPADEISVLEELKRVAFRRVILTANNRPSRSLGVELHINTKPYETWDEIFREVFNGWTVNWKPGKRYVSETWEMLRQ